MAACQIATLNRMDTNGVVPFSIAELTPILTKAVLGRKRGLFSENDYSESNQPIVPYSQASRRLKYGPNTFRVFKYHGSGSLDLPLCHSASQVVLDEYTPLQGDNNTDRFMAYLWSQTKTKNKSFTISTFLLNALIYAYCMEKDIVSLDDTAAGPCQVVEFIESPNTVQTKGFFLGALYGSREQMTMAVKNRINILRGKKAAEARPDPRDRNVGCETLFCASDEEAARTYSWNEPQSEVGQRISAALREGKRDVICEVVSEGMTVELFEKLKSYREHYVRWMNGLPKGEKRKTQLSVKFRSLVDETNGGQHNDL